ncbi:hypothetical protein SESBI_26664 [Sesbania bispinosa]|nr:hypothetical protein SESBI_26664 [Sesbania bispinosa]
MEFSASASTTPTSTMPPPPKPPDDSGVTKNRKPQRIRGKVGPRETNVNGNHAKVNRFAALNKDSNVSNKEVSDHGNLVNESTQLKFDSPKIWKRKKRLRKDFIPPLPKIVSEDRYASLIGKLHAPKETHDETKPGQNDREVSMSKGTSKVVTLMHKQNDNTDTVVHKLPHDIQTTMHVEMISANHLRFLEEPEPPDLGRVISIAKESEAAQHSNETHEVEEVVEVEEEDEDSEMVPTTL